MCLANFHGRGITQTNVLAFESFHFGARPLSGTLVLVEERKIELQSGTGLEALGTLAVDVGQRALDVEEIVLSQSSSFLSGGDGQLDGSKVGPRGNGFRDEILDV